MEHQHVDDEELITALFKEVWQGYKVGKSKESKKRSFKINISKYNPMFLLLPYNDNYK